MATNTGITTKDIEDMGSSLAYTIGGLFRLLGLGLWQLRHLNRLLLFTGAAAAGGVAVVLLEHFGLWTLPISPLWLLPLPPLLVVVVLGIMRQSDIELYRKAFLDVGFKGRDGKAPYLISKCDLGNHRTGCYFRSNISIIQWKKSVPNLQTALDCTVLKIENGKSKKIVHVVLIPADIELKDMLPWLDKFMLARESLIVLGESIAGLIQFDFNKTPHWIFAGDTGSGKSVLIRSVVFQCLVKGHKVYLMDFKRGVEFGKAYDDFCEVVMDKARAVAVLTELVKENVDRLDEFRRMGVKNLGEYNAVKKDAPLERIVVFIDELAILLIPTRAKGDKELTAQATDCLENIAILGRAAGINMVFGIQRPDANTVSGQIKSNVSGRVCGHFSDGGPSMIVLGNTRATELDSDTKGRFMFQNGQETIEMQGYYQTEEQVIEGLVNSRHAQYASTGSTPDLPLKAEKPKNPKPQRTPRRKEPTLNFDYGEDDTA